MRKFVAIVACLVSAMGFAAPVASIGETTYETLTEAFTVAAEATDSATTITLVADANEAVTIPAGATVTLDLNGHNLTSFVEKPAISNNGALKIVGDGKVSRSDMMGYVVDNAGTIEIAGGDYKKTAGSSMNALLHNTGSMTISGGSFYAKYKNDVSADNIYSQAGNNFAVVTVTGGDFQTATTGFKKSTATVTGATITGGTFVTSVPDCYPDGVGHELIDGKYVVSDGFVAKDSNKNFYKTLDDAVAKATSITLVADVEEDFVYPESQTGTGYLYLNNHTLNGNITNKSTARLVVGESATDKATSEHGLVTGALSGNIFVKGGKFTQDPVDHVDKYAWKTECVDGAYVVVNKTTDEINAALSESGITASTGTGALISYFDTVQSAWFANRATGNVKITLLAPNIKEQIIRHNDNGLNLVLNGNSFSGSIDTDIDGTKKPVVISGAGVAVLDSLKAKTLTVSDSARPQVTIKDAIVTDEVKVTAGLVTIEGGTYAGKISGSTVGKLVIAGGTFVNDPSKYLADGYVAVQNDEGLYEVRDHVIVTIPEVEHATATVTVNGVAAEIVDGKVEVPVGAKVVVKYAPEDTWVNTKTVTIASATVNQTVDVGTYQPVPAKVKVIAKDGTVSWASTLSTNNAKDGATYILLDDLSVSRLSWGFIGCKNNDITIDLGGHTLTSTSTSSYGFQFTSNASNCTMTMKNGTFVTATDAFYVNKTNSLILDESLTVESAKACAVVIGDGATLETSANLTTTGNTFAIAGNGSAGNGGTTIKVTGGSVTTKGKAPAIYQPQNGTLEISGGTITGATAVYVKSGDVDITGGTLVANGSAQDYTYNGSGVVVTGDALVIDNCNYPGGAPSVSVTGGRFESAHGEAIASYAGAKAGETAPAPITGFVSGSGDDPKTYPTFNQPLAKELCAPGFQPENDNGEYSISKLPPICFVEEVGYWSLQEAVNVAAQRGSTIELVDRDITITERVIVPEGKKVVLDLNGQTLTSTAPTYAFGLQGGANFEITNGTLAAKDIGVYAFPGSTLTVAEDAIVTSETFYGLFINGANADIKGTIETTAKDGYGVVVWGEEDAPFDVTVSGTVRASGVDAPAIGGNGTDRNPANKLTIVDGATISAEKDVAIFWPNEGTLTVSGGAITSGTNGIYMKAGSLNVTGGTISSTASEYEAPTAMVNGSNGKGSAIVIEESAKYGDFGSIAITGGSFTSKGPAVNVFGEGAPQQFIAGGSFSNKVPDELCHEDFNATEKLEDGSYGVTRKETVAKIGSREFWSIDRAIEAAEPGQVVELVADYKGPGFVVGEMKDVVFSTAGFTYTATSPISVSGHLVINDESKIDFTPANPEDDELFAAVGFGEKIDISAGSFNVPLKPEWCDDAYQPAEFEDGRFGVEEKQHVCMIGDKGYWSVEAALKAANPFDTIVMIEDVKGDAPAVTLDRGHVTIDLNGHVISSVLVSGAVVTVQDSKRTGYIGGADVDKAITVEAGKLYIESGKVVAKDKAVSIEQSEKGELIDVGISGGTFIAPTVLNQKNVHKLPSSALDQITISVTDGVFTGNVYAEDKRAFITGGQFDPPPEKKYKRDDIKAELPSVTVTTELDVVNPYDFKISLREAFLYAEQDAHNGISEEGGYKITFNWDAIKADAAARGVEATGVFDMSAEPFEATSELYDDTTGRCKFILIDGTLDAGADGLMGEGDRMAIIRGLDFHTKDTVAPVRAVIVDQDPESIIKVVERLTERESVAESGDSTDEDAGEVVLVPDEDAGVIDDSGEGVCELDGELYTSVRQALAAVPADGEAHTLKLVDDFTGKAFTLETGKNVVLDLDGHRFEVTNSGFTVQPGATLALKNGSIRSNTAATLITNAGALTLHNLDLDLSERPAVTSLVKTVAGTLVVTGSTDMMGRLEYVNADSVEFRGTGNYDLVFDAPLTAKIRIYSGHFADADAVPVEYQVVPLDGLYWQITDGEGRVTKYETLHEAYATVPGDGTPVTIVQLFDQTDRGLVIDGNKNVTVDFNGRTYTVEGENSYANFIINGKREVVTLKNGTLRTTAPGNLISNMGHLTLADMNIDLRTSELNPDFANIVSSTYGETLVTGDTRLAVPADRGVLAVTAQRNDDWAYDKVQVTFDDDFTGQVIGQIRYGESTGSTKDASWLDAARIDVNAGEFDVTLVDTTPLVEKAVENMRLHGGTFTKKTTVGARPVGDFAYTEVDIDWEVRTRYVHFERCSFDLIGRDVRMLVDRSWFEGNSARRPDWILESDSTGKTYIQFLNSVIHGAEGAIFVNEVSRGAAEQGGYVLVGDSTIGETTGKAAILVNNAAVETYLVNATFYGNTGKTVDTVGHTRAVNVLSQKNGENLPTANIEIMTSIYQEEYADAEIFRMSEEDPTKPHFDFRWLRAGTPVEETAEGAWSLTPAYHLNDESVAGGNCRYIKLAIDKDGYVETIRTALKQNGTYAIFAGSEESESPLHTLYYDQTLANLDRGQPSKGAFWIPVDEPSLVVTTIRDTVNPTDLEISLREAINYAKYLATEDQTTISTITFDWDALDEELAALRKHGIVGTAEGQLDDFAMYLGWSIDWDRRSNTGDCHLIPGKSASKPISITAEELPQGLIINANRSGSVRPYFTVDGSLWGNLGSAAGGALGGTGEDGLGSAAPEAGGGTVAFDLGDNTKLKTDHFRVTAVNGTGYQLGKDANLYLVNSSAADHCVNGIVGDEGSTVVLERTSVALNSRTGVSATNVSAQNVTISGGEKGLYATEAQLFNTTVVGGINATTVNGVNDIVAGPIAANESWFRYSAFDAYPVDEATTNVTHNVAAGDLQLAPTQSSLLWHYRFPGALDWGRYGTAVATSQGYQWNVNGAAMPTYVWGQRTSTGEPLDVETANDRGAQALPDTWAAYPVGSDKPHSGEMTGAILNDIITNTRNPHEGQLSMGAWQANTIVAWKTLAKTKGESTDHATDFSRIDLNTYYSTLQDAVDALAQNASKENEYNVQFEGKDAVFLVSSTLTNSALGDNLQTVISKGDVAIVGNSYYYSGIKATERDAALIVSNNCSVAIANVGFIESAQDAIKVYDKGDVTLYRSAINGNGGDGVNFTEGASGNLLMFNTTVANNKGTGVRMQDGTAQIYGSTVVGNNQGLAGHGAFYLANSVILRNAVANEEKVTVKGGAYNVMTKTGLTEEQVADVFYNNSLTPWYRMVRVNYTGAAGWMGTKVGRDAANNWYYLDRGQPELDDVAVADWKWRSVKTDAVAAQPSEIITTDQHGESRLLAEYAGFHEYAVGAYVPEMELEVEVMDQIYSYNGKAQNPDPNIAIYRIRTGIGKLNQGHDLYYNAADKKFYSEFAWVTNRVTDALGVAPAPWGVPTVSKERTDLGDFTFSADILPIQAGDKINVLRRDVPGAATKDGFSVDKDGYAYIDGYPFYVTDVVLKKGTKDISESYTVVYPQTEDRDYAKMYITPKAISLSRAFSQTKEYDGTTDVIITSESLEHAGVLFGEVVISPASKFDYNGADVLPNYQDNIKDGSVVANDDTKLQAEGLGFVGSSTAMGNYYITTESQNYTSVIVPKRIRVSLGDIAKKLYDGETTTMTFDFTDDRLIYTATNKVAVETYTLGEALVLPTRYIEGRLTVCQTNVIEGVVQTNATQVFAKDAADYPFFVICEELHVYDSVDQFDEKGDRKDFARNYAFDFTTCESVYTVEKKPVTLPIAVDPRVYDGTALVAPATAVDHEPIPTGVKDEAFTITTLGDGNARYETPHVKGDEAAQKIKLIDPAAVDFAGVNGADANNYIITFAPTGAILRRPLAIQEIKGVQTKLYDGSTVVRVDSNDTTSYSYVAATEAAGLVGTEFVKLTGSGRVDNMGVGATQQKVIWDTLAIVNDTGLANDYDLQDFKTDYEDVSVRIEPCDLQLAFSTTRIYDGTLDVSSLALAVTTTNAAGKVSTLKVTPVAAAEGAVWSFKVQTAITNERTDKEEIIYVDVVSAELTSGVVNTYAGDKRDVLVVSEVKLRNELDTGAVLANYRAFVGDRNVATERDLVGMARIERRPITFKAEDRSMVYGGLKPVLTEPGSYVLLNEADLAAGDKVAFVKLAFDTNNIRKSRSGEFQKGYYEKGIVRGDVSIVDANGVSKNRNYTITVRPGALQVGPGTLTMVLDPTPFVKDYDGTINAEENYAAITLKGLIENNLTHEFDDVTVTGVFTYDTKDVVLGDDGSYTNKTITFIRTAIGGKDAANYDWATDAEGNVIVEVSAFGATINPRPSTVNISAADKDYDSTCVATPAAFTFDHIVTGEAFTLAMGGVTAGFADKHAGAGKRVTVSLNAELETLISPENDASLKSNYAFTFDPATTAAIRGIPLTITANALTMTYGDTNPLLVDQWQHGRSGEDSSLAAPTDTTYVGDTVAVSLAYADELEKSTSGNFTTKTHEEAIELKTVVITDAHGEDVTDSYEISYTSAELTVAPRTLTVSVEGDGVAKVYDGTTAIAPGQENHAIADNITAALAKNATADDVDVTGAFAYDTKDVVFANATYANKTIIFSNLELTGTDAGNYTLGDVAEVSDSGATITPFETTVTIAANDKTYDGNKRATAKSAAFAPLVCGEKFELAFGEITGHFDDRHAATDKRVAWNDYSDDLISVVDATGAIKSNYAFVHNLAATATINPKPATITFAAKNKVYDATVKAERTEAPFVFEGLVTGNEDKFDEAFTLDDASMSYAFSDKNVGEGKTVTASGYDVKYIMTASEGGESVPSDYVFTFTTTAKATISQKPMTISYTTKDKVYDATPEATRDAFTYDGLCAGDDVTLDDSAMSYYFVDNAGENTGKDVGEKKTVRTDSFVEKGVMKGKDVGNYSYTFTEESTASITRRPVTIAFELVEKTYDGTVNYLNGEQLKLLAPVVTNMADGESLDVQATGEFVDKVHNEAADYFRVDAFAFKIAAGQDLGNYTVTYAGDRALPLPAGAIEYVMPNEAKANSFRTAGRINRKPLTISAKGQTMVYGDENPDLNTSTVTSDVADWSDDGSLVAGDVVTVTLKYGDVKKSTSGHFVATEGGAPHAVAIVKDQITIVDSASRDVKDSYKITFVDGTLAVSKRPIDMTLEGPNFVKIYDGDRKALQSDHELVNTIETDVVDVDATYTYSDRHVATVGKTITASSLKLTGVDANNYKFKEESYVSTTGAVINVRPTTIKLTAASKTYNGNTKTDPVQESFSEMDPVKNEDGKQEGFTLNKGALSATFEQSDVGQGLTVTFGGYTDELVSAGDGTVKSDYAFTFVDTAKANITKRPSTITWAANDKQYDAKVRAEVTPASFKFGDLVDGESFTMNEAGFTYTFDNKNVGTAKPVTAVPNGTLEAQISPVAAPAKVSNYAFTLTKTAPADITPAPLTITFTTKDKTYDATPKATRDAFTYAPLLVDDKGKTDVVTLDDSAMEYEFIDVEAVENTGKNAAENKVVKTVTGKGYDKTYLRGVDKDNYNVTFTDASTATINKMELRLDLPKADKVYDATTALREGSLVKTLQGAGTETFTATAAGAYKDTHANDYETYVTVTDLSIVGANGAVFGNYVIKYAGHGAEAIREQTETGTYENANFNTTEPFGTPGRITALGFTVAAINQTMTYGDSYPVINGDGEHWGEGVVWSLPGTKLAAGDRIWVTLKWNASIPTSSAGYYTADAHEGALVVDKIVIQRKDGTDVTASYKPTFQSATLTINPRLLTVTVDGANFSKVYDGNRTTEAEDRKYKVDEAVIDTGKGKFAADVVTVNGTYTYNDKDVEKANTVTFGELTLSGADAANYTLNDVTSVDSSEGAKITRRPCDITVTTTGKTYDGNVTANAITTYAFSNLVQKNESGVKEDFTLAIADFTGTFNSKDVETANTVTFTHEGDIADHLTGKDETSLLTNYAFTFKPTAEAKIDPLTVKVSWKAEDKDYDQSIDAEPKLGSFVFTTPVVNMRGNQESFSVSDANAKAMTYAFSDKNVGKGKTVTASGWKHDLVTEGVDTLKSNYIFDFVPTATAEIRPITLTISYTADDKVYDATTNATRTADFTYTGLINGDVFTLNDDEMYYGFDTKNVGVDKTVTAYGFDPAFLQGADVQNYTVAFTTNTTAAITKKAVSIVLPTAEKVYDGTVAYDGSLVALAAAEGSAALPGGEVFTATATGEFNSKLTGSSATYFNVTNMVVTGTEGADFGNYTIRYGAVTAPVVGGDDGTVGYTIDVAALNTTEWATTDPFKSSGTITKKPITVAADAKTVVYGEAYPVLTFTGETGVAGDTLTVPLAYDETKIKQSTSNHYKAGVWADAIHLSSDITISDGAQDVTKCYTITFNPAALTVTQRDLSMTLEGSDFTKEYDGNTSAKQTTHTLVNTIAGDKVDIAGTYTYSSKDVTPVKTVTANALSITGDDAANYQLTATSYTSTEGAVITAKPVVVSAQAQDKSYDGTTEATAGTSPVVFDGLVAGETLTYTDTLKGDFASPLVGTGIAVTYTNFSVEHIKADDVKVNYSFSVAPSVADITTVKLVVTAKGQTMTYGDAKLPSIVEADDWTVTGLIGDDAATVTLDWAALDQRSTSGNVKAGTYADVILVATVNVTHGGADATASYAIETVSGALKVGQKPLTIVLVGSEFTKTYDGTVETEQKEYHFAADDVVKGDTVTATGSFAYDEKDASATRVVTMSEIKLGETDDSVNYELTNPDAKAVSDAHAVIEKKTVTVKAQANDKVYDKTAVATSQAVTFDGLVAGETLAYPTTLTGTFADVNVGTGIAVTWNDFDWTKVTTEAVKANYTPDLQTSSAKISAKTLTISALPQTMFFGEARPDLNADGDDWKQEGLVAGDVLVVTLAYDESKIAKSTAGHAAIGVHNAAIVRAADGVRLTDEATSADMSGNYTVVFNSNTLTVLKGEPKPLYIGWANKHLPIAIDPEWLDRNVEAFKDWDKPKGNELTSDGLLVTGKNGYALWQSYLLGLDPQNASAKIWINGVQTADEDKMHVLYPETVTRPVSDYAVHFRLDADRKAAKAVSSPYQSGTEFDIALGDDDPTGYYTIQCVFTSNTVASANVKASDLLLGEGVKTVNTFGLLKVESATTDTILSVPWCALNPSTTDIDVSAANLLKTAGLEAGDKLYAYSPESMSYVIWQMTENGALSVLPVVSVDSPVAALVPTEVTVARGGGMLLKRTNPSAKPIYLFGQVPSAPMKTTLAGAISQSQPVHHLVGAPGLEDFDVQQSFKPETGSLVETPASSKLFYDQIFIPSDTVEPIMYTYRDGKWGYDKRVTMTYMGMTFSKTERVTDLPKVKAGLGFWYVSRGGNPTIAWPTSGKEAR